MEPGTSNSVLIKHHYLNNISPKSKGKVLTLKCIKNLGDHPVNKAEDRTKETRVVSVMMVTKMLLYPIPHSKIRGKEGLVFREG